jgi:hypothetical protein
MLINERLICNDLDHRYKSLMTHCMINEAIPAGDRVWGMDFTEPHLSKEVVSVSSPHLRKLPVRSSNKLEPSRHSAPMLPRLGLSRLSCGATT